MTNKIVTIAAKNVKNEVKLYCANVFRGTYNGTVALELDEERTGKNKFDLMVIADNFGMSYEFDYATNRIYLCGSVELIAGILPY